MTAIVMNTMTGAVTEYGASFDFNSITPTHAANASGLFALGGDTDAGVAIDAQWLGPKQGGVEERRPDQIYVGVRGPADSAGRVRVVAGGKKVAAGTEWQYDVAVASSGISRSTSPGRGIRENYLAYGYENVDGADFSITLLQVDEVISKQRKVV